MKKNKAIFILALFCSIILGSTGLIIVLLSWQLLPIIIGISLIFIGSQIGNIVMEKKIYWGALFGSFIIGCSYPVSDPLTKFIAGLIAFPITMALIYSIIPKNIKKDSNKENATNGVPPSQI